MIEKTAFFISPPYMLPRMSTSLRVKLMPTKTDERVPSKSALARRAPQLTTVKPGTKSSSSIGVGAHEERVGEERVPGGVGDHADRQAIGALRPGEAVEDVQVTIVEVAARLVQQ